MPSHFGLICHLNRLNLHLMYLIKTISQQRQIIFFLIFLTWLAHFASNIDNLLSGATCFLIANKKTLQCILQTFTLFYSPRFMPNCAISTYSAC
jgi:hypothetical protein